MFRTTINLKTENQKTKMETICTDIAKKDDTFKFTIEKAKFPWDLYTLTVWSTTRDKAKSRGGWLTKATGIPDLHYIVREENQ